MSSITIRANTSGNGKASVVAPATNTNRTLTLPDSTGTMLSTADIATQAAATAGTDNSTLMTPSLFAPPIAARTGYPTGAVIYVSANSTPTGFLRANGAAVSRTTYANLFSVIGTTYGAGDGSTTFNLPDLRGEFPRGFDDGRGVDSGRGFGTAQGSDFQSHNHTVINTAGPIQTYDPYGTSIPSSGSWTFYKFNNITSTSTGGAETRPRNTAMLACIRF